MATNEPHSDKRNDLIAAGKIGHKVAVIGEKVFGTLSSEELHVEGAEIALFKLPSQYPDIEDFSAYTLVIFDYELESFQEIIAKRIFEAMGKGVNFCFVHYSHEGTQNQPLSLDNSQTRNLYQRQIGLQATWDWHIQSFRSAAPINTGKIRGNEFKRFLEKYGSSSNYYHSNDGFDEVLYTHGVDDLVLGFSLNAGRGKTIVLPFMRDFARRDILIDGLQTLIDSLITYITNSLTEMPAWAVESAFFEDEVPLFKKRLNLEEELVKVNQEIDTFKEAKGLVFQSKYTLEDTIPRFLRDNLAVNTEREETHKEDFWILDENRKRVGIAEVKSIVKGIRESTLYSVVTHRDENGLEQDFPALLFVNQYLQAGSWKAKNQVIDINDCKFAAQRNVLIIRVEDLVRLWHAVRIGKVSPESVQPLLLSNKGWLHVASNLKIEVKPKPNS